ncbi:molybdopterin-dependent oxidoreductase [Curvibacter sp. APW13]|uniref:molybdopterin-dependent oxidoreductase n=1 Tax=Curvibacter sp. APW13 TaxID=3077236 RepID=UPI0028DF8530|nr:molybdopterin-dependent oxidoreductase [Curvibacter sp. APW13]MDT8992287.1 molybdopterin-dependent oxidoreductase [Curvibacter sp. APW13]
MTTWYRRWILMGLVATCCSAGLQAQSLPPAAGKVVLTVSGKVGERNSANGAAFDMEMLKKLPQRSFTTMTPWDKKPIKFTGPLLRDVLAAAKAQGQTLKASALNDYQTTIPADDATRFDVIVARQMDDQDIPVKTKGPLFIVYPYDTLKELRATTYYERSAWQLKALVVE